MPQRGGNADKNSQAVTDLLLIDAWQLCATLLQLVCQVGRPQPQFRHKLTFHSKVAIQLPSNTLSSKPVKALGTLTRVAVRVAEAIVLTGVVILTQAIFGRFRCAGTLTLVSI